MKALTLHQPWASLVALGVKTIETRSWSTKYRGPLAIAAAARPPRATDFGDDLRARHGWIGAYNLGRWTKTVEHADPCNCDEDEEIVGTRCMARSDWSHALLADEGAHGFSLATLLPLGAVVATCTLVDVVPMVGIRFVANRHDHGRHRDGACGGCLASSRSKWEAYPVLRMADVAEDQRPYGDFTPGRFAWLLDDVKPTTERCPACRGTRHHPGRWLCHVCDGRGGCDPVPARGRQGLWEWTP